MFRDQGLTEFNISDTAVKDAQIVLKKGYLLSITIAYTGAAAGQVIYLRDGANNSAPVLVPITLPAAAGTMQLSWRHGKKFETGLWFNPDTSMTSVLVEGTYR